MEEIAASKRILSSLMENAGDADMHGITGFRLLTETDESAHEFQTRLKSYRRWSTKPVEVSPWWCSRYGWFCVEKDLLQCVECRQYLSAHLPSSTDDPILNRKSTDRLRGLLTDAHSTSCSWKTNFTHEESCSPNVSDFTVASAQFLERAQSLLVFFPTDAAKKYSILENVLEKKGIFDNDLVELIEITTASSDHQLISKEAIILALLGWKNDESCKECIYCEYCLRRIGLWNFPAGSASETDGANQKSPAKEKSLDPINQHHRWCPWITSTLNLSVLYVNPEDSGSESVFIPTWFALYRLIKNRGKVAVSSSDDNQEQINTEDAAEHFVLARQLLNETLDQISEINQEPEFEEPESSVEIIFD